MELNATRCYRALLSRDRRFDGRFFTGVVTTGVYCRPVCPVVPPKLENTRFFACAAAAEAAGFRPCRRCRPETSPGTPAWLGSSAAVSRALRLIADGALDASGVEALATRLGMGARQLRRLFASHLGASPIDVARARRAHFARRLLDETELPITRVALAAGFTSIRQFNHAMRATFRATPSTLRGRRGRHAAQTSGNELVVRLAYRPPLHWTAMLAFLKPRAIPGVELVEGEAYRRTIAVNDDAGVLEIRPAAHPGEPHLLLRVCLPHYAELLQVVERARRIFDLDADPFLISSQLQRSAPLRPLLRARPGLRVPGTWDAFELAVRAVLGQQVTVRGATTLAGRLVRTFGTPVELGTGLTHLFPAAATLAPADLTVIGLPRARAATLRALAQAVAAGTLRLDAAHGVEDAVARLRAIRGIGEWTAHYIAMRAFGEPDAFPADDLGLRRALGNGTGPLPASALSRMADAWRPWRAYAAMYLWSTPTETKPLHHDAHEGHEGEGQGASA